MQKMPKKNAKQSLKKTLLLTGMMTTAVLITPIDAQARSGNNAPTLIITSDDLPESLRRKIYGKPARVRSIKPSEITGRTYRQPTETLVTRQVHDLRNELSRLHGDIESLSGNLQSTQRQNDDWAADYYASIATINTQLQAGTTPGNPRLVGRLSEAETKLEALANGLVQLNTISSQAADLASEAGFLLEEARAAYGISGAVEEDHVMLRQLEDSINNTVVIIDRLLSTANDDITRATTYLSSERNNLRTLSLAVTNGDLYGKSLANRPFSSVATAYNTSNVQALASDASYSAPPAAALPGPRPLAKIRFDRADVAYEQPVYAAVNEALERYPNARFDLVAVHPTQGNAAQIAIESTKARRNAEKVLRTLTQMGLPLEKIDLSYSESADARTNEVHLFVK